MSAISSLSSGRWSHGFRRPGPRPPAVRHLQTVWPPARSPPPAERTAGYVLQIHLFLRSISSPPSKAWPYGRHGRRHDKILHSANDIPLSLSLPLPAHPCRPGGQWFYLRPSLRQSRHIRLFLRLFCAKDQSYQALPLFFYTYYIPSGLLQDEHENIFSG